MKLKELSEWQSKLHKEQPQIALITGGEGFDRAKAVDAFVACSVPVAERELRVHAFDGTRSEWNAIAQELGGAAFFGAPLVLVRAADKLPKAAQDALTDWVEKPHPQVTLLLEGEGIRANSRLFKRCEAQGWVLQLQSEKEWAKEKSLPQWIVAQVRAAGKQMDMQTAALMVQWIGTDKQQLNSELEKLLCYIDEASHITQEAVGALCLATRPETVFKLTDAVLERRSAEALRLLHKSLADQVAPLSLLRQLRGQFASKAELLTLAAPDIKIRYPYMTDWIVQKNKQAAERYGYHQLLRGLLAIDATELQAKNSDTSPALLLDKLILTLTEERTHAPTFT